MPAARGRHESGGRATTVLGIGAKVPLTRRLGLRLQGRLLVPVLSASGAILIDPGGSTAIIRSTVLFWGDLSAGLYLRF
jgi:hypothetical protein